MAPMGTDQTPLDSGRRIGKYRLVYPIGEGGMSVVYLARDEVLDRQVAIKILHRHLARDPEARARFSREARAVARLTHRNIPEIYDFSDETAGSSGGAQSPSFIVSEYVDGAPLSKLLREGPALLPEVGAMLTLGVARALMHAHGQNVVHRDVKPENVLVGKDGVVKLTDFGIAQIRGLESMTMTGTLIGSPAHMAPEQIEIAKDVDQRADVWGLGTVLYMAVTGGKLPFEADNPHRLLKKIVEGHYTDPRRLSPHVDARLAGIIAGCLVVDRDRRYASASLVARDLEAWLARRGFTEYEAELKRFMADPEGMTAILATRLTDVMMTLGDEAVAEGDRSAALEHFGRVLVLDPDRDEALERVRKLERQLRARKGARWTLLALAMGGLVAAGAVAVGELWTAGPGAPEPVMVASSARALARATVPATRPAIAPAPRPLEAGLTFGTVLGVELERADKSLAERGERDRDGEATRRPQRDERPGHPDRRPPKETLVPVRLTVFPPAVRIRVDDKTIAAGSQTALPPGRHQVTLTHAGCPECAPDTRTLVVPEPGGEGAPARVDQHYVFERRIATTSLEPATLLVKCEDGAYVTDADGRRYECNVVHALQVRTHEPELIVLTAHSADGARLRQQRFTLSPKRPIVWTL